MSADIELGPEDVRAARALLQWSQGDLAKEAAVGISTIAEFEKGSRTPIANNLTAIRRALEAAGVRFTSAGPTILVRCSRTMIFRIHARIGGRSSVPIETHTTASFAAEPPKPERNSKRLPTSFRQRRVTIT